MPLSEGAYSNVTDGYPPHEMISEDVAWPWCVIWLGSEERGFAFGDSQAVSCFLQIDGLLTQQICLLRGDEFAGGVAAIVSFEGKPPPIA